VLDPNDPVITYNANNPPTQPTWGQIGKWVRTVRLNWNTNFYKAYFYKRCAFRLKFPKTYNPNANDGKKYPMLVFFHGLGETGSIYDNEYQLYQGGNDFSAAVDNGIFDGYVSGTSTSQFALFGALIVKVYNQLVLTLPSNLPFVQGIASRPSEKSAKVIQTQSLSGLDNIISYPNSFSSNFTLSFKLPKEDNIRVELFDISGRLVYQKRFENLVECMNSLQIIPRSELASGIYMVKLTSLNTKISKV
jgi:hypothetical protein